MRVLYLGSFTNVWCTESYIARALKRAGCEVMLLNETIMDVKAVWGVAREFQPDLFLFAKARFQGIWQPDCRGLEEAANYLREDFPEILIAGWVFDLLDKGFAEDRFTWGMNASQIADRFFVTDGYTAPLFRNAVVLRQGVPDDVRPGSPYEQWRADVCFLGSAYRDRDAELLAIRQACGRAGASFLHVPEGIRGGRLADLMASVKIVVGPVYPSRRGYWCADEATEVLTSGGWKTWDLVKAGELAYTINPATMKGEWQPITDVAVFAASDCDMLAMEGQRHSSLTTLDHRWLVQYSSTERTNQATDNECPDCGWGSLANTQVQARKAVAWHRRTKHGVAIKPHTRQVRKAAFKTSAELLENDRIPVAAPCANLPCKPLYDNAFVELVAWVWTEGSVSKGRYTSISQSHRVNPINVGRIRRCLRGVCKRGPSPGSGHIGGIGWREHGNRSHGMTSFSMSKGLSDLLWLAAPEHIVSPAFLMALTEPQLRLFVGTSVDADGCRKTSKVGGRLYRSQTFAQKEAARLDSFDMACAMVGIATSRSPGKGAYSVHLKSRTYTSPLRRGWKVTAEKVKYSGIVWCPTTCNGTWLARRRGTIYFTGNSNRIYVVTGYGGCFLAPWVDGMDADGWEPWFNVAIYDQELNGDLEVGIRNLLEDDCWRERIRAAGQQHAMGCCKYDHRVQQMLTELRSCARNREAGGPSRD